jgi:hypothetical protein
MTTHTSLAVAPSGHGMTTITQPDASGIERDLLDFPTPAARPRKVVAARWRLREDGRLETHWLPSTTAR